MPATQTIENMEERLLRLEDALAQAAAGLQGVQVELDPDMDDALAAVEYGVNLLVTDLGEEMRQSRQRAEELAEKLSVIESQRAVISELSTPVLEIWDGVLALPVIGVVDTRRSLEIMDRLLSAIELKRSKWVILDITGVEVVDTKTADHFIKVMAAAQMLGTQCVLTGVRPAVAQTLVEIGATLSNVTTRRTLHDGLRECLKQLAKK